MAIVLDGTSGITTPDLTDTSLTSGRVVYAGTGGNLTGASTFVFDGSNLGLGTASPAYKLDVAGTIKASGTGYNGATSPSVFLTNTTASTGRIFILNSFNSGGFQIADETAGGATRLQINSVGNATFEKNIGLGGTTPTTSGVGITFPATQSASSDANTLDDYEEGTFTPTLTGAGGGSATYGARNGAYVKVGKLVTVNFWIYGDSKSTLSGALTMNLPFASSGASEYRPSPSIRPNNLVSVTGSIGGYVPSNSTNLILAILNNGSGSADLLASNLPSSAFEIGGSLSYIANV